jgi:urea carboxylase
MFNKVLIANRGAIACRIIRTLKSLGVSSVAVYSEADRHAAHVTQADEAFCIGPPPAPESYLDYPKLLQLAREQGVDAIHPGYGFLSENAVFAEACEAAGIAFIGPTPRQMREFGLKHTARQLAEQNQVPLLPGTGLLDDLDQARSEALRIGYPVMLKSTAGGGGIGMQLCRSETELAETFHSVARLALNNFSQSGIFLEKYIEYARHIEVQIFGDGEGRVVALGERDCSVQRRNQKVIEETPAPGLSEQQRAELMRLAVRLGEAVAYRSAGTVEFVYDTRSHDFYFLEMNTRLQVEHGVTEEVTGVDLVAWMVRLAAGERAFLDDYRHQPQGAAIQARLYAEDPGKSFQPSSGLLSEVRFDPHVRVDTWVETGSRIPPYYDPMLAKVIVRGDSREAARSRLLAALNRSALYGIEHNLDYLRQIVDDPVFVQGEHYTRYLDRLGYQAPTIDVLAPGTQTTVQDYPGRTGYWDVGIPPSGPMDALAFRLANRLLGNPPHAAALELTLNGPSLKFNRDCTIALTGAAMKAQLNGETVRFWRSLPVKAGSVLKLGATEGSGVRAYLAVRGGFDVPAYMGSRATFTLGRFGGHAGRALQVGDVLHIDAESRVTEPVDALPAELIPAHTRNWDIHVIYGPHGAPDFFTDDDIATFFATDWEVHYNSSRTGVRLIGPKPQWARSDGGEAGLHPSNIHDNAYAIGSIDFTGDMPVILGPDGPSLGGFVCPVTIVSADLWKVGQLSPGDRIRFRPVSCDEAVRLQALQDEMIQRLRPAATAPVAIQPIDRQSTPIVARREAQDDAPAVCYRQSGDQYLLVEYGPLVLDLELRFRVHALMEWLHQQAIEGLLDLTPGIRSLQIHYDSRTIAQGELVQRLLASESQLPSIDEMSVPSRIVHLPLSWDDPSTRLAIDKYMQSVRSDAPWCPSNIEFIRRINGLESIEQVKEILFNASYLVMGLGDVYLGAPVATPLDPRHRLVTTKYNPARTWTPENAVGIGGAYLCVYSMEGPGGYQFVGRTVQMWNRYRQTQDFTQGKQWLLRFFDQLRFYPVSEQELKQMREAFPQGRFNLHIEETTLKLGDYRAFLERNAAEIERFKQRQQAAFDAERQRWEEAGQVTYESDLPEDVSASDAGMEIPPGCLAVASSVTGSVWELAVKPGDKVEVGDPLVIIEAMKMEITIAADEAGTIREVLTAQGSPVSAGQAVVILELEPS